MSAESSVFVKIGSSVMPLSPQQPIAVEAGASPAVAFASIRCDTCGMVSLIDAPVTYRFYDDDHFGYIEV
jgi:hypothetical protein